MKWTTTDPDGVLNTGTRWSIQFGTPHTIRVVHGLYVSDLRPSDRDDDLIIWTVEKHGVPEDRPYSGRRRSFSRWEPAKLPVFERDHVYRHREELVGEVGRLSRFLVLHVFEDDDMVGRVITLKDGKHVINLSQVERNQFEDVTGQETER